MSLNKVLYQELFDAASTYMSTQTSHQLSDDMKLNLYGLYKQAKLGKNVSTKPGMFDFVGKAKWNAWNELGSMDRSEAMHKYIELVSSIDNNWQDSTVKMSQSSSNIPAKKTGSFGPVFSSLVGDDDEVELTDDKKTVFDWCRDGNIEVVSKLLASGDALPNDKDDSGMALLHWACDRGHEGMIEILLKHRANINVIDDDGQTPLHFAVTCDHTDIVQLLVAHNADPFVKDIDGTTPFDSASASLKLIMHPNE